MAFSLTPDRAIAAQVHRLRDRVDSARMRQLRMRLADSRAVKALGIALLAAALAFLGYAALRQPEPSAPAAPAMQASAKPALPPAQKLDPDVVPTVEPMTLMQIDAATARALNATVPFSTAPNPPAAPFRVQESLDDLQRSVDCLAAAVLYEAGDDAVGERAVAQVVLNRVRHPAFPHSVCGVVFQGSERRTGCQFTFTCDGAITRPPDPGAWARAQQIAREALAGYVFAPVGYATHYHTDWVIPYWSSSLEKVVAVGSHLFFRWPQGWGTPAAFRIAHAGSEPIVAALASLSDVHKSPQALGDLRLAEALKNYPVERDGSMILVGLDASLRPEQLPELARALCGAMRPCRVLGWMPRAGEPAPLLLSSEQVNRLSFSYQRGASGDRAAWNCAEFGRDQAGQCLDPPQLAALKRSLIPEAVAAEPPVLAPSVSATPAAAAQPPLATPPLAHQDAVQTAERIDADIRKERDRRCAAMRLVARANRIGPCARRDH